MALTMWFNVNTERRMSSHELADLQRRASCLYQVNTHLFEDEREALEALGALPLADHLDRSRNRTGPAAGPWADELTLESATGMPRE